MTGQLLTIARNTFQESIRQPIFSVLIFIAGILLVMNPSLAAYTLDDDNKLLIDLGLSTLFVSGLLLAAFTATGVLVTELEQRTVLTVVSKPVARPLFIAGKFLGIAAAIGVAYWVLTTIFLLTVRHQVMQRASDSFDGPVITFGLLGAISALVLATLANYLYRWVFTATFVVLLSGLGTLAWLLVLLIGKGWEFQHPATDFDPQLMGGLFMIFQAVLILTAVAIAVSTRLGQVMTLLVCIGVFILGLVSDYLGTGVRQRLEAMIDPGLLTQLVHQVAEVLFRAAPNLQFLWPADAINQGHDIPLSHLALVSGYTALYIVAVLALAVALFQQRDVG